MKENNIYKAPDLGKAKVPNLGFFKASNLGCKLSSENGIMCRNVEKHVIFE